MLHSSKENPISTDSVPHVLPVAGKKVMYVNPDPATGQYMYPERKPSSETRTRPLATGAPILHLENTSFPKYLSESKNVLVYYYASARYTYHCHRFPSDKLILGPKRPERLNGQGCRIQGAIYNRWPQSNGIAAWSIDKVI